MIMRTSIVSFLIIVLATLWGCSSSPKVEKEVRHPELTVQIASLNLSNYIKKIEKKHIIELAHALKKEQVEAIAVQGIVRYPGINSRVDFVGELSKQLDWRNEFGEMMFISGRQTGNAIFSFYPILSHFNQTFDGLKSSDFNAALEATIDVGVRPLVLVSTELPNKASDKDLMYCMNTIADLNPETNNPVTIVSGNLPSAESIHTTKTFSDISTAKRIPTKFWFSDNPALECLSTRIIETELGTVVVAQFGLYR